MCDSTYSLCSRTTAILLDTNTKLLSEAEVGRQQFSIGVKLTAVVRELSVSYSYWTEIEDNSCSV